MEANEKIFADGLIVKRKDSAPEWVKANLSVKVEEFKKFLDTHNKNGWVNIDVLQSKGGKLYAEKNTWEPKAQDNQAPAPTNNDSSDLPF
jgi:hypothetical protein|tara:strand:+ start:663 stop:932 length:270 start_codon:yes stop_codon:yes gene_type:complete